MVCERYYINRNARSFQDVGLKAPPTVRFLRPELDIIPIVFWGKRPWIFLHISKWKVYVLHPWFHFAAFSLTIHWGKSCLNVEWYLYIEIIYIYKCNIHISFPWQTGCANMAWLELMLAAPLKNWMLSCSDWRSVACSVKNCWQWFSVLSSFKLDPSNRSTMVYGFW